MARPAEAFDANPDAVIVSGNCLRIGPDEAILDAIPTPPRPEFDQLLRHPTNLAQPATFLRAEAYRQVGGLNRRYNLAMDVDLWFRLASAGRADGMPLSSPAGRSLVNHGFFDPVLGWPKRTAKRVLRAKRR